MAGNDARAVGTPALKLFISYAREDLVFVDRLAAAVREQGIEPVYDRTNIEKLAVWSDRINQLIGATDTVLFVLSPDSVVSEGCAVELSLAVSLNKRLAPLVARDVPDAQVPPPLARLNFVFCREADNFAAAIDELVIALQTDAEWIHDHTRLGEVARRWEERRHPDELLLRGAELVAAADWLSRHPIHAPAPTDHHRHFVDTSIRQIARAAATFDEKIKSLLLRAEFAQAKDELEEAAAYLAAFAGTPLQDQFPDFELRRQRITQIVWFYQAANEVYVKSGEEDFDAAMKASKTTLETIGVLRHERWWEQLPTADLTQREADRLKFEVHRQLLLASGLSMRPGFDQIVPRSKSPSDSPMGLRLVPAGLVRALLRFRQLSLLHKQDKPEAAAFFKTTLEGLARVHAFEAAQDPATFPPSRTGQMLTRLAELAVTFFSGPAGARIDYRPLLDSTDDKAVAIPEQQLNPADYYFLGLFNFFIAKRHDAALTKFMDIFPGLFPNLDPRTPYDTAERLLRAGVSREPENFWPHFVLGRTLLSRGDFRGAELAFNVCISLFPTYARGYEQRALALAGQWRGNHFKDLARRAQEDSERALELAGDDPSTYWPRGELLEGLGDMLGALEAFTRWMEMEENAPALMSRGTGVKNAYDLVNRLLKQRHTQSDVVLHAECLALLAIVHRLWKQDDDALGFANRALELAPQHAHALTARGIVLRKTGQLEQAIVDFDAACKADSNAWLAMIQRAETCEELARHDQALRDWTVLAAAHTGAMQPPGWIRRKAIAALEHLGRSAAA